MNRSVADTFGQQAGMANGPPRKGLFGMVVRNEVDIAATPIILTLDPMRQKYFVFSNFYCPVAGVFVFRAPPVSYEHNVFTLPFPLSLWSASAGLVLTCAVLLGVVIWAERVMGVSSDQGADDDLGLHSGSDAVLLAVAAVCQQGADEAHWEGSS